MTLKVPCLEGGTRKPSKYPRLPPSQHHTPRVVASLHFTCLLHLKPLNCDNPTSLGFLPIQPNGKIDQIKQIGLVRNHGITTTA